MPIVEMRRIMLIGNNKEKKELLKTLTKAGSVEIGNTHDIERADNVDVGKRREEVSLKLARLTFAFDALKEKTSELKRMVKAKSADKSSVPKKVMFAPKPEVSYDDFVECTKNEDEIFRKIEEMNELNNEYVRLKSEETKLKSEAKAMSVFESVKLPLDIFRNTKNTVISLGSVASSKIEKLENLLSGVEYVTCETGEDIGGSTAVVIVSMKESRDKVQEILAEVEFTPIGVSDERRPADIIAHDKERIDAIAKRKNEIVEEIVSYEENTLSFKMLFDYYTLENDKLSAEEKMKSTGTSYILEGWLPKTEEENIDNILLSSPLALAYIIREPIEGEIPPTFCVDNSLVAPYQSVTNMFNVPCYREVNPNPFVAFFFFLFFGIMVSDAGYGLILTLASGFILFRMKPKKMDASLIKIIFMGGISTMFWGVMFGSYFGEALLPAVMFNPLDKPVNMLILSLGMGLFQMLTGMAINAYRLFKERKPLDAIFGVFSWYILIIGIAVIFLVKGNAGKITGIVLLAVGLVGLMIAGALHKKGVGIVSGAFGKLYGIINFFSDLLSYSRLFGLGLATGVIGMVLNQIAVVLVELIPVLGIVLAAALLIGGHLFNVGINTLGAYVHNSRLQFIEFFGKFYTGGGRLFAPLGSNIKYYYITDRR